MYFDATLSGNTAGASVGSRLRANFDDSAKEMFEVVGMYKGGQRGKVPMNRAAGGTLAISGISGMMNPPLRARTGGDVQLEFGRIDKYYKY